MVDTYRLPQSLPQAVRPEGVAISGDSVRRDSGFKGTRHPAHQLSASQLAAIRAAMQLFIDDDLASGVAPDHKLYCVACERVRPAAGFIQYTRYLVCNGCAIEYEIARARGLTGSIGQYVRDKNFGEASFYALDAV